MLADLIGTAYAAALEPEGWSRVLEGLADAVRADTTALIFADQITGKGWMVAARADPAAPLIYFDYFASRNPIRPKRNKALDLWRDPDKWRRTVLTDEHALAKPELMRSEYYGDFMRPYGMHSLLMAGLAVEGTRFASLSFMRPRRRDQFGSAEMALLARLQPHLIGAFELGLKFRHLRRMGDGAAEFLDRSPDAVFLVDGAGRVFHLNRAAEVLVAENRGLAIRAGILCAMAPRESGALRDAISAAGDREAELHSGSVLSLLRPGARALPVMISPMRSDRFAIFSPEPLVLVCASDPDSGAQIPADRLKQLFGLTRAEAKIAIELSMGHDAKTIAERQSLSIHTVRVHIARILAKTETSRQADLVRLLARVCNAWMDFPAPRQN